MLKQIQKGNTRKKLTIIKETSKYGETEEHDLARMKLFWSKNSNEEIKAIEIDGRLFRNKGSVGETKKIGRDERLLVNNSSDGKIKEIVRE